MSEFKRIIATVENEAELQERMVKASKSYGGAWTAYVMPFSHEAHLLGYESPSRIPDANLSDTCQRDRGVAYKGKMQPFTKAQVVREQNRGFNADR